MDKIFQISGYITKITTMAKNTMRLQVDTQENVSGEAMKRIFDVIDQLGNFIFVVDREIQPEDLLDIPAPKPDDSKRKKTKSQTMRAIIYRIWEKDNEKIKDFELFYDIKMDRLNNYLKENFLE